MAMAPDEKPHGVGGAPAAFSPPPAAFQILETTMVQPSAPTSGGPAPPETSIPLTFYDIIWLHHPPVQSIHYYRLPPDADVDAILANLRAALSHALRAFYPLAGRLRLAPGGGAANRYEIHYRPGDGVAFTVAEYGEDVDGLSADAPRDVARIAPLASPLAVHGEGGGSAVLALRATVLSARRGLVLGATIHHAACDGAGATHFLHTLAAYARRDDASPPPVLDRTSLLDDARGLYDALFPAAAPPAPPMPDGQRLATVALSKDDLQRVKAAVVAAAAARGVAPPPRCSTLVATLAFVWSCYQRAKGPQNGGGRTSMLLLVDHRSRRTPPLPEKYFGNCIRAGLAFAPAAELAEPGGGGLLAACAAIVAGIDEAVRGVEAMEPMGRRIAEAARMGMLPVAGSPWFRVYDLDMGFGRPAKVEVLSAATTGAVVVAENPAGDGGTELAVPLPQESMDAFLKCFAEAIAGLSVNPADAV